jgi:hypothetical protein
MPYIETKSALAAVPVDCLDHSRTRHRTHAQRRLRYEVRQHRSASSCYCNTPLAGSSMVHCSPPGLNVSVVVPLSW